MAAVIGYLRRLAIAVREARLDNRTRALRQQKRRKTGL